MATPLTLGTPSIPFDLYHPSDKVEEEQNKLRLTPEQQKFIDLTCQQVFFYTGEVLFCPFRNEDSNGYVIENEGPLGGRIFSKESFCKRSMLTICSSVKQGIHLVSERWNRTTVLRLLSTGLGSGSIPDAVAHYRMFQRQEHLARCTTHLERLASKDSLMGIKNLASINGYRKPQNRKYGLPDVSLLKKAKDLRLEEFFVERQFPPGISGIARRYFQPEAIVSLTLPPEVFQRIEDHSFSTAIRGPFIRLNSIQPLGVELRT